MAYIKEYTETLKIIKVVLNFMKYEVFSRVRKDKPDCELCHAKFKLEDNTNLAVVVGKQNYLICDNCAEEAIQGGADFIER